MEELKELKTRLDNTKEEIAKLVKHLLWREFQDLFLKWPEAEAIRWTQYTPYFNDGDPCVFRFNGDTTIKLGDRTINNEDGFFEDWEFDEGSKERDLLQRIHDSLEISEYVLQSIFGDYVQVTVWRGKEEAEVEDYDHD